MAMLTNFLIILIALLHCYFLWFEMFAWTTRGRKVFKKFPSELFEPTKALAANQGLYNGFLAAGLLWTFLIDDYMWRTNIAFFFLGCVAIAGIYGALTADRKIFFVQALPALITTILLLLERFDLF
jgi:putative membrane protein